MPNQGCRWFAQRRAFVENSCQGVQKDEGSVVWTGCVPAIIILTGRST